MITRIDRFNGEWKFLSNFWPSSITYQGLTYPTVEHAYQAAKSTDPEVRKKFLNPGRNGGPGNAKRMGQRVVLREDWERVKLDIMLKLLRLKFSLPDLRDRLKMTGEAELIEGNTWHDTFWGTYRGQGENHLGRLLMQVRKEIHDQTS